MTNISKLIFESYKGRVPEQYASISKESRDKAVMDAMYEALGVTPDCSKKAFKRAWREHKNEIYAIIEDVADAVILDGELERQAFINQFCEIKNEALGDKNEFYVEGENQLEFVEFSGSHWNLRRTRLDVGTSFSTEVRNYGLAVYEYFERITAGRVQPLSSLAGAIADAMQRKIVDIAQATLSTAVTNLPTQFKYNGSYDEAEVLKVCQHVQASNHAKPVLVGTSVALASLQGKSQLTMSNNMADQLNAQGFLSVWKGFTCMEIAQGHKIGTFDFTMDDDKIYVLAGDVKPVKIFLEGDTEIREVSDGTTNADRSVEQDVCFKAGAGVIYNRMFGVLEITA